VSPPLADRTIEHVTCLGCGCACDDIAVMVEQDRITAVRNACALGEAWFGDGRVPGETHVQGRTVPLERAVNAAARLLTAAERPLVYVAADVSCEAQRAAVAIADRLRAALDALGGSAAEGILAAQRRGRAGATLGEIRQRADVIVFWAVDPADRYPRYASRYAVSPRGLQATEGRSSRTVIAVDVGPSRGPDDADTRVTIAPGDEVDSLGVMRAIVQGRLGADDERFRPATELARRLLQARYVALVADGEPGLNPPPDADRAEALLGLAQALNGPTRCALSTLRGGGNRAGADQVLTWQTGFPYAVDFARGYPAYRPRGAGGTAAELVTAGEIDAALVVGAAASVPESVARGLGRVATVVIGPRASAAPFAAAVAIDTGVAGIHEGGLAFRMDDVPLPLRPALPGPRAAAATMQALREALES